MSKCISPRITELRRDIIEKPISLVLEDFWAEIEKVGSPLIEARENTDEYFVTFLWRSQEYGRELVVYGEFPGFDRVNNRLEQIPGTDVYYKTFPAPANVWSLYIFRVPAGDGTDTPLYHVDPLNPLTYTTPLDDDGRCPLLAPMESVVALPGVKGEPWRSLSARAVNQVHKHLFFSHVLNNERRLWVYTPPGYSPKDEPFNVLFLIDGWEYLHMAQLPQRLDMAIASGQVAPLVVVMIDSLGFKQREKELTCFPPFGEFIVNELMPWISARYHVSSLPQGRLIAGASYGGLAAVWLGIEYPQHFQNIIAQSGAFYWNNDWLISKVQGIDFLSISVWLEVGRLEPQQLIGTCENMYTVLKSKAQSCKHIVTHGGHHYIYWGQTLICALSHLTRVVPSWIATSF